MLTLNAWYPFPGPKRFRRFRCELTAAADARRLYVDITADSRYRLSCDGRHLGAGPARGWPEHWEFDTYEFDASPGSAHRLDVLVQHFPVGTFQYIAADGGLGVSVGYRDAAGRRHPLEVEWQESDTPEYREETPRIGCQQGWEEHVDLRSADTAEWRTVRAQPPPPERHFHPRVLPALSEIERPFRLLRAEMVPLATCVATIDLRGAFPPEERGADACCGVFDFALELSSPVAQRIRIGEHCHSEGFRWRLNGAPLAPAGRFADGALHAGVNLLQGTSPHYFHPTVASLALWGEASISTAEYWEVSEPREPGEQEAAADRRLETYFLTPPYLTARRGRGKRRLPNLPCAATGMLFQTAQGEIPLKSENGEWIIDPPDEGGIRLLFDAGDQSIGEIAWEIDAPDGCVADWLGFEFIQRDGRINLPEGMNNALRCICREGRQCYRSIQRRGLRYAYLTLHNFARPVRLRRVRLYESTYPQRRAGAFHASDERLNAIWEVSARTLACCSEDTYTDCPTYEQTFWVGDARNEALVDLAVNGDPRLSAHCWNLAARSLERFPLVASQLPSGWSNLIPAWSMLWMRWAEEHWMATGDDGFAAAALPWLERQCLQLEDLRNRDGLLEIRAWNLLDWAPMDTPTAGVITHQNCLAVQGIEQILPLARRFGAAGLAERWSRLAAGLRRAVNRHLWDERRGAYLDSIHADGARSTVFSQQTQTIALIADIPDSAERAARVRALVRAPEPGMVTAASPFFMTFRLEELARAGEIETMLAIIRSYWGRQLDAGATTFWECFQPENERLTRSHCHAWSATPGWFLSRYALGLQPLEPGFRRCVWRPHLQLDSCSGVVPTPFGLLRAGWRRVAGELKLELDAPPEVEVAVELPEDEPARLQPSQ